MLTIYGNRVSGSANKVEYTALLLGLKYEYKDLDFRKDLKTDWYLKIHPAGKLPAIEDNGFVLFESGAICRYLAEGSEYYPKERKQRALVDQWTDFSVLHVGNALSKVAFNRVFAPNMGVPVDENSLNEGLKFLERFLPVVDAQLKKSKFLAADKITLADINLFASLEYADKADVDLSKYKNLVAWRKKLMGMDFYKNVHKK